MLGFIYYYAEKHGQKHNMRHSDITILEKLRDDTMGVQQLINSLVDNFIFYLFTGIY